MAMTLVEASKFSNDILQRGVIELLVKDDPVLEKLPFKTIRGNGLTYNVETTMPTAQFYEVGDTWVESTGTMSQATAHLRILGGDADVDNFLKKTRSDQNDLMAETVVAKTKALRWAYMLQLLYGYAATETKAFDGLHYLLRSLTYNTVAIATVSGTPVQLSLAKLEQAIDMVKNGKADLILMSKQMRRNINKYLNSVGGITKAEIQGKPVQTWLEIPIGVSDYVSDGESCNLDYGGGAYGHNYALGTGLATNQAATSIFVLQFDPKALCGLQSGGLTVEKFDKLETKDASRARLKWYASVMVQSIISCAKVTGIANTVVTV